MGRATISAAAVGRFDRPFNHSLSFDAVVGADEEPDRVIAYPDRSRFHRPDCRYAALPGGEKLTRDTAVRRGYDPCGVCKP